MSLRSHQCSSHPELFLVLTPLIVTGQVGSRKGGQTHQVMANPPITFPQEFRLIERDQDGSQQVPIPQLHGTSSA